MKNNVALTLQLYWDLAIGALWVNVFDLLTLELVPILARMSPWLCFLPMIGCWMNTHSVLVSASTLGDALPGKMSES